MDYRYTGEGTHTPILERTYVVGLGRGTERKPFLVALSVKRKSAIVKPSRV